MGNLLYTTEFSGSFKEFASLAKPIWDEKYQKTLLLDFFSHEYLETIKHSTQECYGLATYCKKDPISLCLNLGYEARLFGQPLRVLMVSWFSVVNQSIKAGNPLGLYGVVKMCLDIFETAKKKKYDLILGIAEADSGMSEVVKMKAKGITPIISKPIVAMARVLSKQTTKLMYLNGYEKAVLKILGKEWKDNLSKQNEVKEIPLFEQSFYEDILNEVKYDFTIINKFSQYTPKDKPSNKFFRLFEIRKKGEIIGIIRILDLGFQGVTLIPSATIEQIWTKPYQLRACLSIFISAMKREGKKMIMNIFQLPRASDRFIFFSLGFLPDYSRPVRLVTIPINPKIEKSLHKINSFSVPMR